MQGREVTPLRAALLFVVGLLAFVFGLGVLVGRAAAHDPYTDWKQPGSGASCCNGQDCRPVRAYVGEDGLWRAWDGVRWLKVPADKLLPVDFAKDGRSHLCSTADGHVYCFSPGVPRS